MRFFSGRFYVAAGRVQKSWGNGDGGSGKVGCQVWMCNRKVSWDERKDATGNGHFVRARAH